VRYWLIHKAVQHCEAVSTVVIFRLLTEEYTSQFLLKIKRKCVFLSSYHNDVIKTYKNCRFKINIAPFVHILCFLPALVAVCKKYLYKKIFINYISTLALEQCRIVCRYY